MRVLFIGGAGYVGNMVGPLLADHHEIVVFDRRPVTGPQIVGDATDPAALRAAMSDVDLVVHYAMVEDDPAGSFDVNVKSVYLTLAAARAASVHPVHRRLLDAH